MPCQGHCDTLEPSSRLLSAVLGDSLPLSNHGWRSSLFQIPKLRPLPTKGLTCPGLQLSHPAVLGSRLPWPS